MDSLGKFLKEKREAKGFSLEDAQEGTKIQLKYLQALEEGRFAVLPGEVFAKAFLRSYADFLGLDPREVMEKYQVLQGEKQEETPEIKQSIQGRKEEKKPEEYLSNKLKLPPLWAFLAFGIIVLGIWVSQNDLSAPKANPPSQRTQEIQPPPPQPTPPPKPVVEKKPPLPAPVYVKTIVNQDCWTQVRVDGQLVFEGILTSNSNKEWKGQQEIAFRFGNAGGVNVEYNGQNLGSVGGEGEVVNKTFTPEQVVN